MELKLSKNEYNPIFGFLSQGLVGHAGAAVVARKLVEQISGKADEGKAEEVTLAVELYELEQLVQGIIALVKSEAKISATYLAELLYLAKLLKIAGAVEKALESLVPRDKDAEIDSDLVLDAE